jgi:hypothetical protein
LLGVVLTARLTGLSPDEDKLRYWIGRAIKVVIQAR